MKESQVKGSPGKASHKKTDHENFNLIKASEDEDEDEGANNAVSAPPRTNPSATIYDNLKEGHIATGFSPEFSLSGATDNTILVGYLSRSVFMICNFWFY